MPRLLPEALPAAPEPRTNGDSMNRFLNAPASFAKVVLTASILVGILGGALAGTAFGDGVRPQKFGPFLQQSMAFQGNPAGSDYVYPFADYNLQAGWLEPIAILPWPLFKGSYIEAQGNATASPYQVDFGIAFNLKPIRFFEFGLAYNRLVYPYTLAGFSAPDSASADWMPTKHEWQPSEILGADHLQAAGTDIFTYQANLTFDAGPVQLHGGGYYSLWDVDAAHSSDLVLEYRTGLLIHKKDRIGSLYAQTMMVPDAEVIKVLTEILDDLDLGQYEVKLNHRRLLDAMLDIAGVPPQKFRAICSAIDKLDKEPWEVVRQEMTEEKGLPGDVADKIEEFVVLRGSPTELLAKLNQPDHAFAKHKDSAAALEELGALFQYLKDMNALDNIVFDLSLARGLDYYTGVIYEAVLKGGNVGSIAAGGRYDKLVGMFAGKEVPAVGVSIGIERVFAIMESQMRAAAAAAQGTIRETETQVLVASVGSGMQRKRMAVASRLWAAGVKAEFGFKSNPKMADQLGYALKAGIPFIVLFGEDELQAGVVKLKDLDAGTEELIPESEMPDIVARKAAAKGDRRVVYAVTQRD